MRPPCRVGEIRKPLLAMFVPPPEVRVDAGRISVLPQPRDEARAGVQHPIPAASDLLDLRIEAEKEIEAARRLRELCDFQTQSGEFAQRDIQAGPGVMTGGLAS